MRPSSIVCTILASAGIARALGPLIPRRDGIGNKPYTPAGGQPWDLPDEGDPANTNRVGQSNGTTGHYGPYKYTCGTYATGDELTLWHNIKELVCTYRREFTLGPVYSPEACDRTFCWDTTAIYVCNERLEPKQLDLYYVGWLAMRTYELCCGPGKRDGTGEKFGKSGSIKHPDGYTVYIGYGNCRDSTHIHPSVYGTDRDGVNGFCRDKFEGKPYKGRPDIAC